MRRTLVAVVGIGLLAACGAPVAGRPVPAAGFGPVTTPHTSVSVPSPLSLDGVNLCGLLTADDLTEAGGLIGTPRTRTDTFPESCGFPLGNGATSDLALVALHKPLAQVRRDQPGGHAESTLGYPTWLHCTVTEGYRTCTATVEVRPDRSLLVAVDKRDVSEAALVRILQPLTERAVTRLPRA
ncbi:DUF3558 family protein [Actinokineospora globicatena]|uniref:DUF3558 domain-containing protein n=1 Tax=Actinokineospora globicatena TaxID=103729 RepID=A0A9W6QNR4_9PSEU|nr:DUF3558 family protein [Actinokineospora globicatena]GLW93788.1 hypothetical protein Aglo03_46040 [Actinokineospora globicatena]